MTQLTATSDDYAGDATTKGRLAVGGKVSGTFETGYDADWFRISLVAGVNYKFEVQTDTHLRRPEVDLSGLLTVVSLQGLAQDVRTFDRTDNDDIHKQLWGYFTPAQSGDYFVAMNDRDWLFASYSVQAMGYVDDYPAVHPTTTLPVGGQVQGKVLTGIDIDSFVVNLEAGRMYRFSESIVLDNWGMSGWPLILTPTGSDTSVQLITFGIDASHTDYIAVAPQTGSYAIALGADVTNADYAKYLRGTGSYQLALREVADDYPSTSVSRAVLTIGKPIQARIEAGGDADTFGVSLQAGRTYVFAMTGKSQHEGTLDLDYDGTKLTLSDGSGNVLRTSTSLTEFTYTPFESSLFYLTAGSMGAAGTYTLVAKEALADDYTPNGSAPGRLRIGEPLQAQLEQPGDIDWFRFDATGGTLYMVSSTSAAARIVDRFGLPLKTLYDNGREAETGTFTPAESGTYYLVASGVREQQFVTAGARPVDYMVAVVAVSGGNDGLNHPVAGIAVGSRLDGAIDYQGETVRYAIDLVAGIGYRFELGAIGLKEGQLSVTDQDGAGQSAQDGSTDNVFGFTPTSSGKYYLNVTDLHGALGSYTISASAPGMPAPDSTAPHIVSYPGLAASSLLTVQDLVMQFDDLVTKGSGHVKIKDAQGATVLDFNVATSTGVTILNGSELSLKTKGYLKPGQEYTVNLDSGSIVNAAGLAYDGKEVVHLILADSGRQLTGTSGSDLLILGSGFDTVNAGAGLDSVRMSGPSRDYSSNSLATDSTIRIHHLSGALDTDVLTGVERVLFDDGALAYDTEGSAGQTYRLYQAAFNRMPDQAGLGYWIGMADKGLDMHTMANGFLASQESISSYGTHLTDDGFVDMLYRNVLARTPDQAGKDYWLKAIHSGMERADVLIDFSESTENHHNVAGLIAYGIAYVPYG